MVPMAQMWPWLIVELQKMVQLWEETVSKSKSRTKIKKHCKSSHFVETITNKNA